MLDDLEYLFGDGNANLENVFGLDLPGTTEVESTDLLMIQSQESFEPEVPVTSYNHIEELEDDTPTYDSGSVSFTVSEPLASLHQSPEPAVHLVALETSQRQLSNSLLRKRFRAPILSV